MVNYDLAVHSEHPANWKEFSLVEQSKFRRRWIGEKPSLRVIQMTIRVYINRRAHFSPTAS